MSIKTRNTVTFEGPDAIDLLVEKAKKYGVVQEEVHMILCRVVDKDGKEVVINSNSTVEIRFSADVAK